MDWNWIRIDFDFMDNILSFFTMELFANYQLKTYNNSTKASLRIFYFFAYTLYSIPDTDYNTYLLFAFGEFLYFYLIGQHKLKHCFWVFIKYEAYILISDSLLIILHTYLVNDFYFLDTNKTYDMAKNLICSLLSYIILCLHIYGKRLSKLHARKHYGILFSVATLLCCFILSYFSLMLVANQADISHMLPVVFSLFFLIIAVCLTSYQQVVLSLTANADQMLLITRYETEHAYYKDVDKSLEAIKSLRHDFKNHLLILDNYARKQDMDSLHDYITRLNAELTDTKLIQTANTLVSAILNAKSHICHQQDIRFTATCSFSSVNISDFHLITILGNILDNAITAASKVTGGYVHITIQQTDSFLEIICENNHQEKILKKNGQFVSTKEGNNAFHGIGIKNIQNSVSSLNGTLDISYTSSLFTVTILVPNYL